MALIIISHTINQIKFSHIVEPHSVVSKIQYIHICLLAYNNDEKHVKHKWYLKLGIRLKKMQFQSSSLKVRDKCFKAANCFV